MLFVSGISEYKSDYLDRYPKDLIDLISLMSQSVFWKWIIIVQSPKIFYNQIVTIFDS